MNSEEVMDHRPRSVQGELIQQAIGSAGGISRTRQIGMAKGRIDLETP
jgi:hypothetical protein